MKSEIDTILDDLLGRWHKWRLAAPVGRGYASTDSTCRDYNAPTHWDWLNGAEDDRADNEIMRGVDRAIEKVPQPWNTAIQFEARNLHTGRSVWHSPRLPTGQELEILVIEARTKLLIELNRGGVIGH